MDDSIHYLLVQPGSGDLVGIDWLSDADLHELLENPEPYSLRSFLPQDVSPEVLDKPGVWPNGSAVLLRVEIVTPVPVTARWKLP